MAWLKTIEKNAQGSTTSDRHAVYDGLDLIADLNESDSLVASYTHGPGIDDPLIVRKSGDDYFYYKNHQGSVTELRDSSGAGYKTYVYDAFGNMEETGPTFNRGFTYTGRELHNRSGLYYYRARFYDPELGRFLTQDPIGYLSGMNLYAYVGNNPVDWIDPFGFCPQEVTLLDKIGTIVQIADVIPINAIPSPPTIAAGVVLDAGAAIFGAIDIVEAMHAERLSKGQTVLAWTIWTVQIGVSGISYIPHTVSAIVGTAAEASLYELQVRNFTGQWNPFRGW